MGFVRKTITFTEQQDSWIKTQIITGHYSSYSEFICALIVREQERYAGLVAVSAALVSGEISGDPKYFDAEVFKQNISATHHLNKLEDFEFNAIADARANQAVIKVSLDDL